jgi:hypothetical protein
MELKCHGTQMRTGAANKYAWFMRSPRKADEKGSRIPLRRSMQRWDGNKEVCDKMFVAMMWTTVEIRVGTGGG